MSEQIIQIDCGFAVFGVVVADGVVIEAAPIARWMVGNWWTDVERYWKRRKAKIHLVGR